MLLMKLITFANAGSVFAPTAASKIAAEWDNLYSFLIAASLIACVILLGGMTYFVMKYKRKTPNDKTAYISHNSMLEFLWSFIPLCIFLGVFAWGWSIYHEMRQMPPEGSREIHVFAKRWQWEFEYKNGLKTIGEFKVPIGVPVKLIMTSVEGPGETEADKAPVIHSFYIPSFRIKQDVVPGRYTTLWFQAEKFGEFHVFCAEFCGMGHSNMMAKMIVVPKEEFEQQFLTGKDAEVGSLGAKLYKEKSCIGCHSLGTNAVVGPGFKGLFGKTEEMDDGTKVVVDENYLRESIEVPAAKTVKGFPKGAMPSFQGQLTEEELLALVDYIKDLK
jgi:cytochrome c oxidase subunit 2